MLISPDDLQNDLDRLEDIEKASLRLVVQAIYDYRAMAVEIFHEESDLVQDIGEDITREAMDRLGTSKIDERLFGKIDYKRARYVFHPEYAIKQALFVDSKAEKTSGEGTATLQMSQISMRVRLRRRDEELDEPGRLPSILEVREESYITTTIFVKYNYDESDGNNELQSITVAAVPNGILQDRYNLDVDNTIWRVGRDAPSRGEDFRVRLSFEELKRVTKWRVQKILLDTDELEWDE